MTFDRFASIAGAFVAAAALSVLGVYVLRTHHDNIGLGVGVTCVVLAIATIVPVQLKAGARSLKDAGHDVQDAVVVIVPTVEKVMDSVPGGDRHTDPPAAA